ncbi:MAG: hypothetical protein ABIJ09_12940 [Pseudomonadota bacterium]
MSLDSSQRSRRWAVIAVAAVGLVSCNAGVTCQGCGPTAYTYPSQVAQGAEPVDEGMRARLTERGLDFIVGHLDAILAQAFPPLSTDPSDPDSRRAAVPFSQFGNLSWGDSGTVINFFDWTAGLALTDVDPASYAYILLEDEDGRTLRDKITADFIEPGSIALHIDDLRIGIEATAKGTATLQFTTEELAIAACMANGMGITTCTGCFAEGWPAQNSATCLIAGQPLTCCRDKDKLTNVDIACDMLDGNVSSVPERPGYAISMSLDITLRPAVTNQNCRDNARSCLLMDAVFDPLTGLSIDNIAIDVVNSTYQDLCTDDDQLLGTFVTIPGEFECDAVCPVLDTFVSVVENVADLLGPVIDVAAGAMVNALLDSLFTNLNGTPLETANRVALGDLAAGQVRSLNDANDLGFLVRPSAGTFRVSCPPGVQPCELRRGMDMVLSSGFEAVHAPTEGKPAPNRCVRPLRGVDFVRHYGAVAFEAPTASPLSGEFVDPTDQTSRVYDVAGSVALAALNQAAFAAYNAGLLCLELSAEDIYMMTDGAFALTAGMVDLLSGGDLGRFVPPRAPALIVIAPELPPTFAMGTGADGDPLLQLNVERLHISMYALMYERMVRVFEVVASVYAGLDVVPDPATRELTFQIAEGPDIGGFEEIYNELLPYSDFSELLPTLVELAFGTLLTDNIQFSYDLSPMLEQALGVPIFLTVDGIESVDAAGERSFINIYLSFSDQAASPGGPLGYRVLSDLQLAEDPGLLTRDADGRLRPTRSVRLEGHIVPLDGRDEYSFRVDGSAWRAFVTPDDDGVLTLTSPLLGLTGHHRLEVRGRRVGAPETLEPEPQVLRVTLDPDPPTLALHRTTTGDVVAEAHDLVSDDDHLEFAFALDGGDLGDFTPRAQLDAEDLRGVRVVSARARDEAGHLSPLARIAIGDGVPSQDQAAAGCSCASGPASGTFLLSLLGGLVLARRRRR